MQIPQGEGDGVDREAGEDEEITAGAEDDPKVELIFPDSNSVHVDEPCTFLNQDPDIQIVFPTIGMDVMVSVSDHDKKTREQLEQEAHDALEYVGLTPIDFFF